jgi:hypothetical protein
VHAAETTEVTNARASAKVATSVLALKRVMVLELGDGQGRVGQVMFDGCSIQGPVRGRVLVMFDGLVDFQVGGGEAGLGVGWCVGDV